MRISFTILWLVGTPTTAVKLKEKKLSANENYGYHFAVGGKSNHGVKENHRKNYVTYVIQPKLLLYLYQVVVSLQENGAQVFVGWDIVFPTLTYSLIGIGRK